MNGCIAIRKDVYYVRLTYYDRNHQRKEKWVSTGLSGRGAKQKATAKILTKFRNCDIIYATNADGLKRKGERL